MKLLSISCPSPADATATKIVIIVNHGPSFRGLIDANTQAPKSKSLI